MRSKLAMLRRRWLPAFIFVSALCLVPATEAARLHLDGDDAWIEMGNSADMRIERTTGGDLRLLTTGVTSLAFATDNTDRLILTAAGHLEPTSAGATNLGTQSTPLGSAFLEGLLVSRSAIGATVSGGIKNIAGSGTLSHARLLVNTEAGGGSPFAEFNAGGNSWSVGVENDANDDFFIATASGPSAKKLTLTRSSGRLIVEELFVNQVVQHWVSVRGCLGAQSISTGVETPLVFAGLVKHNVGSKYDTVSGEFTASLAGFYGVSACFMYTAPVVTGVSELQIHKFVSGVAVERYKVYCSLTIQQCCISHTLLVDGAGPLALQIRVYQTSGTARTVDTSHDWNYVTFEYKGPV